MKWNESKNPNDLAATGGETNPDPSIAQTAHQVDTAGGRFSLNIMRCEALSLHFNAKSGHFHVPFNHTFLATEIRCPWPASKLLNGLKPPGNLGTSCIFCQFSFS